MAYNQKKQYHQLKKRMGDYANLVSQRFSTAANALLSLQKECNLGEDEMFSFADNPKVGKKAQDILRQLHSSVYAAITKGVKLEWDEANQAVDAFIASKFGKKTLNDPNFVGWVSRNTDALQAFLARTDQGMNLSKRVWKCTKQLQDEMEMAITVSVGEGKSASQISREVRQYLREPDRLFRRVRDKEGNLKLSKAAKAYQPGKGVYRSSAKNAMRLARTETNMAYRAADYERWQRLDFVTGIHIELSHNHPDGDICDTLQGDYPKDFKFTGWHPNCYCHAIPITIKDDDFVKMQQAMLAGEDYDVSSQMVKEMPEGFTAWATENKERLLDAHADGNLPYFARDNWGKFEDAFNPITNSEVYKLGVSVMDEMKDIPDVDTQALHDAMMGKDLGLIDDETKKLQAIKDELNNLVHVENGLEEAKIYGCQEILKAEKTIDGKLQYWKDHSYSLENQVSQIDYFKGQLEINGVHPKTKMHLHDQYPSWKVQVKAYEKEIVKIKEQIEWDGLVAGIKVDKYSTAYDGITYLGTHLEEMTDKLFEVLDADVHDLGALKKLKVELDEWKSAESQYKAAKGMIPSKVSGEVKKLQDAALLAAQEGKLAEFKKLSGNLADWGGIWDDMEKILKDAFVTDVYALQNISGKVSDALLAGDIKAVKAAMGEYTKVQEMAKVLKEAQSVVIKGKNYNAAVAEMEAALNAGDKVAFEKAFQEADRQKKYALSRRKKNGTDAGEILAGEITQERRDAAMWDTLDKAVAEGRLVGTEADRILRVNGDKTYQEALARQTREKEVAKMFCDGKISEAEFKKICDEEGLIVAVWDDGTGKQFSTGRYFVEEYTGTYCKTNEPLQNRLYSGRNPKEEFYARVDAMTKYIDNCELLEDQWFQRGDDGFGVIESRLKFAGTEIPDGWQKDPSKLVGLVLEEGGFMSTGSHRGGGFNKSVVTNIFAPKGSKAVYVEQFSAYGTTYDADALDYRDKRKFGHNWNGKLNSNDLIDDDVRKELVKRQKELYEKQKKGEYVSRSDWRSVSLYSTEHETLFQRGTQMKITKAYFGADGKLYIDVDVIRQTKRDLSYVDKAKIGY